MSGDCATLLYLSSLILGKFLSIIYVILKIIFEVQFFVLRGNVIATYSQLSAFNGTPKSISDIGEVKMT